jgi:hypothetical protein
MARPHQSSTTAMIVSKSAGLAARTVKPRSSTSFLHH